VIGVANRYAAPGPAALDTAQLQMNSAASMEQANHRIRSRWQLVALPSVHTFANTEQDFRF